LNIGGLDLAAEAAGIRTAAFCERDPFCRRVLMNYWPDVPIFEDVRALSREAMADAGIPSINLIHGGFPCQPFSVAGKQKGKTDDRYLWPEFSRLVGEIRHRWVVAENVPGIVRIAADTVCEDLERLGYSVGIWNFEAAAVGALHRRARIFFVGYAEYDGPPAATLFGRDDEGKARREERPLCAGEPARTGGQPHSPAMAHPGCRMRERRPIPGTVCGECERRTHAYADDQIAHLWPTPKASDADMGMTARTSGRPIEKSTHLQTRAYCAEMFPTPRSADGAKGQRTPEGAVKEASRGHGIDLPSHVRIFPTPTIHGNYNKKRASPGAGDGLETFVKLYPTPAANDAKNNTPPSRRRENGRHTDQLNVAAKGALNPSWVEWLMGFPLGWTDIGG
jgi:DNA (cytosine-5)-methyltransferase 1